MELFSPGHLIVIAIVAGVLFFGWKQLPDMARSAGKSLRVFRDEVKAVSDPEATAAMKSALSTAAAPPVPTAPSAPTAVAPSAAPVVGNEAISTPSASAVVAAEDVSVPDASGNTAG